MNERAIISGFSVCLPYAENSSLLIESLKQGKMRELISMVLHQITKL